MMADQKYCYFPKDFYQSYQAFNSISFEAINQSKGITSVKKQLVKIVIKSDSIVLIKTTISLNVL